MEKYGKEFAREESLPDEGRSKMDSQGNVEKGPGLFSEGDMNGEGDNKDQAEEEPDHRYLGNVEEAIDSRVRITTAILFELILNVNQAELRRPDKPEWSIDNAKNDRMVYVPKDTVVEFMKTVSTFII